MSDHAAGDLSSVDAYRASLRASVRDFDHDANSNRKLIRELLEADPERFCSGAIEVLKQTDDSHASQYLIALLVGHHLLLKALCDPGFTRQQAAQVARAALRIDPSMDVALAKQLADSATSPESTMRPDDTGRVMEVLSEISKGARIVPSLTRLLRHSNPNVRSKAVKMVGRGNGSVRWLRSRLSEVDQRVRANAIEALWGADSEEAREMLWTASRDGNNRVAGNALLALYRLGECSVILDLLKIGEQGSALFRASAAWVMGETGDPRFTEALARMLREPNAVVRARAMAALVKVKTAMAQSRLLPQWVASGLLLESGPQESGRRLQLALANGDRVQQQKILPTQVFLSEDGEHVLNYQVTERPVPETVSAIFVFPRSATPADCAWTRGALHCLGWKRPSALWAVQSYLAKSRGEFLNDLDDALRYSANPERIEKSFNATGSRGDCADLWKSIGHVVRADQAPARGRRHLILFSNAEPECPAAPEVVAAVQESGATVQAIANGPSARLEDFCSRVHGSFRTAETNEAASQAISLAYLNLLARYEIGYQPVCPGAQRLRIRISSTSGWAETQLALTTAL